METGQSMVETMLVLIILVVVTIAGTSLAMSAFGKVLLTRWSAKHSRCVAETEDSERCRRQTANELHKYFAFHDVSVSEQVVSGIVHSKIRARLLNKYPLVAQYDLEPSEYKRVKK